MSASDHLPGHQNAAERITSRFLELLDRQFPIASQDQPPAFRSAHDYAQRLFIHVNHLNRSVKSVTGRPTSAHIAEKIIAEANTLLLSTDWHIGEIAYSLGFSYPAHFNNFYKKKMGISPSAFRASNEQMQGPNALI